MLENLLSTANQVAILFILIFVGFICGKTKIINEKGAVVLTDIALFVATPAAILNSFSVEQFSWGKTLNLFYIALITIFMYLLMIAFCHFFIRGKDAKVAKLSIVFANCGFMCFPLQKAIIGDIGVFYGAMVVVIFNITLWTYGVFVASGDKKYLSQKKILLNPVLISVAVALIIYFTGLKLPSTISGSVEHLSNLNTPIPMLVIGYHLAKSNILDAFRDKRVLLPSLLRMLIFPLISVLLLKAFNINNQAATAYIIAASAPVAAAVSMFAQKYELDTDLSVRNVSFTTLISIITMPLFIVLVQTI